MAAAEWYLCTICGKRYPASGTEWRCPCGGLFELENWPAFAPAAIDARERGLWRYRRVLPLHPSWEPVTLGEGNTPLLAMNWREQPVLFKMESMGPTGSFKDRGASVLVTALRGLGIEHAVEDSSGNAGASLAAYAARGGLKCEIFVPDTAAGPKLDQMRFHGAGVVEIAGTRQDTALAAWAAARRGPAARRGARYASHVYDPFFVAGIETLAYELWEQLDRRAPGAIVLPVGNGTLLLGVYRGFRRLRNAGLIWREPRLLAVQAKACSPIALAFQQGSDRAERVAIAPTIASGIAIAQPARGTEILSAIRASGGAALAVGEQEIGDARNQLAQRGLYVEGTAAVAAAGLAHLPYNAAEAQAPTVVLLTGHGLKNDRGQ
jgi:threonine synthase